MKPDSSPDPKLQAVESLPLGPTQEYEGHTFSVPGSVRILGMCHTIDCPAESVDPYQDPASWPITDQQREQYIRSFQIERERWHRHGDVSRELDALERLRSNLPADAPPWALLLAAERACNAIELYNSKKIGKFGLVPARVGINSLTFADGVCSGKAIDVPMLRYLEFAKRTEIDPEVLRFCMVTGVCAAVLSAPDDVNREGLLILQLRSPEFNFPYGGVPGASIAGYLNVRRDTGGKSEVERYIDEINGVSEGILPVTNKLIFDHLSQEGREELGLPRKFIDPESARILGVIEDLAAPHHEIGVAAHLPFTFAQHARRGARHSLQLIQAKQHPHEFAEHFVGIPPTPANILVLVGQGPPMPPTHLATFVLWGYQKAVEIVGERAAKVWLAEAQECARNNALAMNSTVEDYYRAHPETFFQPNSHEVQKLAKYLSQEVPKIVQETGPLLDRIDQEIPTRHPIAVVWGWLKEAIQAGQLSLEALDTLAPNAYAMWKGVLHTPDPHAGYDPRRLPEEQGLMDQRQHLELLENQFNQGPGRFDWGTVHQMEALARSG